MLRQLQPQPFIFLSPTIAYSLRLVHHRYGESHFLQSHSALEASLSRADYQNLGAGERFVACRRLTPRRCRLPLFKDQGDSIDAEIICDFVFWEARSGKTPDQNTSRILG